MNEITSEELTSDEGDKAAMGSNLTIPSVHAAFEHVEPRLSCLSDIFHYSPGISARIHRQLESETEDKEVVSVADS